MFHIFSWGSAEPLHTVRCLFLIWAICSKSKREKKKSARQYVLNCEMPRAFVCLTVCNHRALKLLQSWCSEVHCPCRKAGEGQRLGTATGQGKTPGLGQGHGRGSGCWSQCCWSGSLNSKSTLQVKISSPSEWGRWKGSVSQHTEREVGAEAHGNTLAWFCSSFFSFADQELISSHPP